MVLAPVLCRHCGSDEVVKHGCSATGKQRYKFRNHECDHSSFIRDYTDRGYRSEVRGQIASNSHFEK